MDRPLILKALADETRMNILILLLERDHCVRALSGQAGVTEAAVSQHLKVLREAGLVRGEKRGHFTHYHVRREVLRGLAQELQALADTERKDPCQGHGPGGACLHHQAKVGERP